LVSPSPSGTERALLMDAPRLARTLDRMARELLERLAPEEIGARGGGDVPIGLVGMQRRGVPLAHRLADRLRQMEGLAVPVGTLDASLYRDDVRHRLAPMHATDLPFDVEGRHLVLVDDVLYTGRSARAALDALLAYGRPASVALAVLVDRGLRELPIAADYVGLAVPTLPGERVRVRLRELDDREGVWLVEKGEGPSEQGAERQGPSDQGPGKEEGLP